MAEAALYYTCAASPIGSLLLRSDGERLTGLFMEPHRIGDGWREDRSPFGEALRQLGAYFAGELRSFDLAHEERGTPFQRRVWAELERIPYGETISYAELARRVGNPAAMRAVGAANGRNPVSIVVPCHRVIGANGTLTGYGGGLERKRWLLGHEARVSGAVARMKPSSASCVAAPAPARATLFGGTDAATNEPQSRLIRATGAGSSSPG